MSNERQIKPLGGLSEPARDVVEAQWDRLRTYSPADLQAMKDVLSKDLEEAKSWEWLHRKALYEGDGDERQLAQKISRRAEIERAIRVIDQLIRHHFRHGKCPETWDNIDYSEKEAASHGRAARGTKREIESAIRAVITRDDYPSTKLGFYQEVDRERGLSGSGRASERWLRENWPGGAPDPDDWPGLL